MTAQKVTSHFLVSFQSQKETILSLMDLNWYQIRSFKFIIVYYACSLVHARAVVVPLNNFSIEIENIIWKKQFYSTRPYKTIYF